MTKRMQHNTSVQLLRGGGEGGEGGGRQQVEIRGGWCGKNQDDTRKLGLFSGSFFGARRGLEHVSEERRALLIRGDKANRLVSHHASAAARQVMRCLGDTAAKFCRLSNEPLNPTPRVERPTGAEAAI